MSAGIGTRRITGLATCLLAIAIAAGPAASLVTVVCEDSEGCPDEPLRIELGADATTTTTPDGDDEDTSSSTESPSPLTNDELDILEMAGYQVVHSPEDAGDDEPQESDKENKPKVATTTTPEPAQGTQIVLPEHDGSGVQIVFNDAVGSESEGIDTNALEDFIEDGDFAISSAALIPGDAQHAASNSSTSEAAGAGREDVDGEEEDDGMDEFLESNGLIIESSTLVPGVGEVIVAAPSDADITTEEESIKPSKKEKKKTKPASQTSDGSPSRSGKKNKQEAKKAGESTKAASADVSRAGKDNSKIQKEEGDMDFTLDLGAIDPNGISVVKQRPPVNASTSVSQIPRKVLVPSNAGKDSKDPVDGRSVEKSKPPDVGSLPDPSKFQPLPVHESMSDGARGKAKEETDATTTGSVEKLRFPIFGYEPVPQKPTEAVENGAASKEQKEFNATGSPSAALPSPAQNKTTKHTREEIPTAQNKTSSSEGVSNASGCAPMTEEIKRFPYLQTFFRLMQVTGLNDFIDSNENLTLLAPPDMAFESLANIMSKPLDELLEDQDYMQKIASLHVITEYVLSVDMSNSQTLNTALIGTPLLVSSTPDGMLLVPPGGDAAKIQFVDIKSCSGVMHIIDKVLRPVEELDISLSQLG